MNLTKRDVLELRRRFKKNDCTISRICGCYVNGSRQVVLKFEESFCDLEDEEFHKYLEIAKKTLSGTVDNNLLELEFAYGEEAEQRQQFLMLLKSSKLKNEELLDRLYEQVIEHYSYAGNYLILAFHDIYDVMTRTSDRSKLDESEEIYEYMICAICPVELSKPGLGYREEENRIGARQRDWVVGLPDIGFVYPAFIDRGSDTGAVMYYIKDAKESHSELIENVLGCLSRRTATEEKNAFQSIVKEAVGDEDGKADAAFLKIQKNINAIVIEQEDDSLPPTPMSIATVEDVVAELSIPDEAKQQIKRSYAQTFGDAPPPAQNLLDAKLVATSAQREHTMALEQEVSDLKEKLAEAAKTDNAPWDTAEAADQIILQVPENRAEEIKTQVIEGRKCLVIPLEGGESARINGKSAAL